MIIAATLTLSSPSDPGKNMARVIVTDASAYYAATSGNDDIEIHSVSPTASRVVFAGLGDDFVRGSQNQDALYGNDGNDTLYGKGGSDVVNGGNGNDFLSGGAGIDVLNEVSGDDIMYGGSGADYIIDWADHLNDISDARSGNDLVYGNLGDDTCNGEEGDDVVRGGQGNDLVSGGNGADYVSGDKGDDTMTGGAGADIFHTFGDAGIDRVTDFNLAEGDRVQVDPGTQYTLAQVGADTVISMTGGGQMILVGVAMSSLTTGWIYGA